MINQELQKLNKQLKIQKQLNDIEKLELEIFWNVI